MTLKQLRREQLNATDLSDLSNALLQESMVRFKAAEHALRERAVAGVAGESSRQGVRALKRFAEGLARSLAHVWNDGAAFVASHRTIVAIGSDRRYVGRYNREVARIVQTGMRRNDRLVMIGMQLHRELDSTRDGDLIAAIKWSTFFEHQRTTLSPKNWQREFLPAACSTMADEIMAACMPVAPEQAVWTLEDCRQQMQALLSLHVVRMMGEKRITADFSTDDALQPVAEAIPLMPILLPVAESPSKEIPAPWPVPDILTVTRKFVEIATTLATQQLYGHLLQAVHTENRIRMFVAGEMKDKFEEEIKRLTRKVARARMERITRELADVLGGAMATSEL